MTPAEERQKVVIEKILLCRKQVTEVLVGLPNLKLFSFVLYNEVVSTKISLRLYGKNKETYTRLRQTPGVDVPQLEWLELCLIAAGINDKCYLMIDKYSAAGWAVIEMDGSAEWLRELWSRELKSFHLVTADRSRMVIIVTEENYFNVYMEDIPAAYILPPPSTPFSIENQDEDNPS